MKLPAGAALACLTFFLLFAFVPSAIAGDDKGKQRRPGVAPKVKSYASAATYKYVSPPAGYYDGKSELSPEGNNASDASDLAQKRATSAKEIGIHPLNVRRRVTAPTSKSVTAAINHVELMTPSKTKSDYLADLDLKEVDAWTQKQMPLHIYFVPPKADLPGFKNEMFVLFRESCDEWGKASKNRISFVFIENIKEADITVRFVVDRHNISRAESGNATVSSGFRGIDSAHIELLTEDAGGGKYTDTCFKETCIHEMGHALGLVGHSRDPKDIMAPISPIYSESPIEEVKLTQRDINTLNRIYSETDSLYIRRHQKAIAAQAHSKGEMSYWTQVVHSPTPEKHK